MFTITLQCYSKTLNFMKDDIKNTQNKLRWFVTIAFLCMVVHCSLLLFGFSFYFAEIVTIVLGFYLVHRIAFHFFRFCIITRMMIYYTWIYMVCIWFERFIGFGGLLVYARVFMLIIGLIITALLIYRHISR